MVEAFEVLAKLWKLAREESVQVLGMFIYEYEGLLSNSDDAGDSNADQQFIMKNPSVCLNLLTPIRAGTAERN